MAQLRVRVEVQVAECMYSVEETVELSEALSPPEQVTTLTDSLRDRIIAAVSQDSRL